MVGGALLPLLVLLVSAVVRLDGHGCPLHWVARLRALAAEHCSTITCRQRKKS